MSQMETFSPTLRTEPADPSMEIIILLIFGLFMALFGVLLPWIYRGALPYAPDSTHGLFLVLLSLQAITLGKTPFGDFRRSWLLVALGTVGAITGMVGCFIPGLLHDPLRLLVGWLLTAGGLTLLLGLLVSRDKARLWLRGPAPLRHLTLAAGLVYGLTLVAGLVTLFPGMLPPDFTAPLLMACGASFFYLAGALRQVRRLYPPPTLPAVASGAGVSPSIGSETRGESAPYGGPEYAGSGLGPITQSLSGEAALSLDTAILLLLAILLGLLGVLLFPVALGLLPFSPDGQLGLILVLMAIQILALGDTPAGRIRRSGWLILAGMGFAGLGIFSSIVPGVLTDVLRILLGLMNLGGNLLLLAGSLWPRGHRGPGADPGTQPLPLPSPLRKLAVTQTLLYLVGIAFGLSMLLPGLVPLPVIAGILLLNGALLFQLALLLRQLDGVSAGPGPEPDLLAE